MGGHNCAPLPSPASSSPCADYNVDRSAIIHALWLQGILRMRTTYQEWTALILANSYRLCTVLTHVHLRTVVTHVPWCTKSNARQCTEHVKPLVMISQRLRTPSTTPTWTLSLYLQRKIFNRRCAFSGSITSTGAILFVHCNTVQVHTSGERIGA